MGRGAVRVRRTAAALAALVPALVAAGPGGPPNAKPPRPAAASSERVDRIELKPLMSESELARVETKVSDRATRERLLGDHPLTLQWIGWDRPGRATVSEHGEQLRLSGGQESRKGKDWLSIEGVILQATAREITFQGTIRSQVTYVNHGRICERVGTMQLRATGKRKYWRLKQMDNCEGDRVVDYVDLFFKKLAPAR